MRLYTAIYRPGEDHAPPFVTWQDTLTFKEQAAIEVKLRTLELHGPGYKHAKSLKQGLWELKIGAKGQSALRVYLSFEGGVAIILYGGSGKGDQSRAIKVARERLKHFKDSGGLYGDSYIRREDYDV